MVYLLLLLDASNLFLLLFLRLSESCRPKMAFRDLMDPKSIFRALSIAPTPIKK